MKRAVLLIVVLCAAGPSAGAAVGQSDIYTRVLQAYEQQGSVPPCQFTSAQLQSALHGIDTYGAQYFQDFSSAVQAALTARAAGQCSRAATRKAAITRGASRAKLDVGGVSSPGSGSFPAPIVALAVICVLLALVASVNGVLRWGRFEPPALASWRHSRREAAGRLELAWLDLRDRLGSRAGRGARSR